MAGAGKQLRPHTYTQPKPLIPVAGKPILAHIVDQLISAGVQDFVFVIGYLGEKIQRFIEQHYKAINAEFVVQHNRLGLGHAISLTAPLVDADSPAIIALGDTYIEADIQKIIDADTTTLGIRKVKDPRKFGVAEVDNEFNILRVTEKPLIPKSNLALVGWYKIQCFGDLIEVLEQNIKNQYKTKDEFQLTDGLMLMIKNGVKVKGFRVDNWYDCGQKEVLLEINSMLLKNSDAKHSAQQQFKDSIIIPPVFIGKNAEISSSIIGPNLSIGDNATISNSIVKNSIIGSFTKLNDVIMQDSIIGSDSNVTGSTRELNIGDNTELKF